MDSPSFRAGGREKRRYARLPTSQNAHVRFGDGAPVLAEIRDFCPTGFYAAFPGGRTPDEAIPALAGTPVEVTFAAGNKVVYRCSGRIAHVSPGGVGVFAPAMPEGALNALRSAGGQGAKTGTDGPGIELAPPQAESLKLACTSLLRGFLDVAMRDFFEQAGERLIESGQHEPSFLERSRFEYGAQELAHRRSRIEGDFFEAVRHRIQDPEPVQAPDSGKASRSKLALVDEAEFEDWLNLSAVVKQVESNFAPLLDGFERRYSRLVGLPIDRKNNPYGPEVIGRAFQGAIQALEFSNPMRTVLYRVLGQSLSQHGVTLYRQLNETLAALQPAEAPPSPPETRSPPAPEAAAESRRAQPDLAEVADTLNDLYKQDQSGASPTAESGEYSLDRILATLNQFAHRSTAGREADTAAARTPEGSGVLHVVDRLKEATRQLGAAGLAAGQPATGAPPAGMAAPQVSLPELLKALDGLPLTGRIAEAGAPQPSLVDQLHAGIAAGGGVPRQLAPGHRQVLETTSGLFERARADLAPSSDIEALVRRLERPLLKLALQDARFPSTPDHPARQVLNLIEQYAVAADDKGRIFDPKLQRFLYLLVDRVCSRADEDPGIFETVRDSLEKVLLPILQTRRSRVARLQEASEGRERIRVARARVNAALEERLAGREVPGMLLRLLDAGWRQHLVLLELREGAQGDAWNDGVAVLEQILAWLGPDAGGPRDTETVQATLGSIERALGRVNVDPKLLTAFIDELAAKLAANVPDTAQIRVPPGRLAGGGDEGSVSPRLGGQLRVGAWWDISVDGSRMPMQLIWASEPPFSCTFANRSATNKLDYTLAELSRQIDQGVAKPGKDFDLPLVERSEQALFDETYQRLATQAMHDPLTGLLNRRGFMQRLGQLAPAAQDDKGHAVGILEFDQFRLIYNTCGVEAAEALTRDLAARVRAQAGPDAVLAAFRDDTLAILLPNCGRSDGCQVIDGLLNGVKDHPFQHAEHSYSIGVNIGITEYAPTEGNAEDVIRRADSACITAKSLGRNRMQVYEQASPQLQTQESLMDWAGRIDTYLKGNGLYLRCQLVMPIAPADGQLPYYEILLGIESEGRREIRPMDFIPAVERLQRAHEVDIWVVSRVFEWIRANRPRFDALGGFSINLSATSLSNPEVKAYLQKVLAGLDFPAGKIIFEITETAAIGSYGAAQEFIREIRRYGCKFSLDDFGSGFTSYSHLKNLRTDALKIDGSFVKDMLQNPADYAMVKSMNDIGHSLGLKTVAEYVESPMILEALRQIGVDYAQGYAIHKPCPIVELTTGWPG